jgi:autotransporter-associated beta strand protein/T5SS/PEP-CTERM-associated repeat protein
MVTILEVGKGIEMKAARPFYQDAVMYKSLRFQLRTNLLLIVGIISVLVVSQSGFAALVTWNVASGDFSVASNWGGGVAPANGDQASIANGGTATIGVAGAYPSSTGSYIEFYTGDGNSENSATGPFMPGTVIQQGGTTVNVGNWFEIGRLFQYAGPQVSASSNVASYTMYGNSVVNTGQSGSNNANSTGAEIGWGWTNVNGLSNTTGILTLNDSSQFNEAGFVALGQNDAGGAGILNVHNNAQFNMTGTQFSVDNFHIGTNGSTGQVFVDGNGSVTVNRDIMVGDGSGTTGGTVSVSGNGSFSTQTGWFFVRNNALLTQSGNAVVSTGGGRLFIGDTAGNNATYNLQGGTLYTGDLGNTGGTGTFNQSGGLAQLKYWFYIGTNTGSLGTYNLTGGTLNIGKNADGSSNGGMNLFVGGNGSGGQGVFNLSNGLVTSTGNFHIGESNGSGTLSQTGGTIDDSAGGGEFWVGNNGGGNGIYNLSGSGVLNVSNWLAVGRNGATGVVTMNGGTINKTGGGNIIVGSLGGNGTWNMNAGLITNNSQLVLGENSNTGTFFLNGGTVQAIQLATYGGTASTAVGNLYLNGGVLQATAGNTVYAPTSNFNTYVQAGGAIIDTNGNNIQLGNLISTDPALVGTDGGLHKRGAGKLGLTANNSYNGATTVNAGTLLITGSPTISGSITVSPGASLGTDTVVPAVTIGAGSTFSSGYTFSNLGQTGTAQPASLTTASGGILAFKLSNSTNNGNDQIDVAGNLSLANSTVINLSQLLNNALSVGSYPLILAPSNSTSVGSLILTGAPLSRQSYSLSSSLTEVELNVSAGSAASLLWAGGLNGNAWDVALTKNWLNTGAGNTSDFFFNLDNVTFNDSGAANGAVTINGALQPGSITLSMTNGASAYSFSGTGSITGNTGLVMNGVGTLTVNNSNSYTGETDIHGGNLVINSGGALGDSSGLSLTYIGGPSTNDSASVTIHSGGTLSGAAVLLGSAAGSNGALTQNGGVLNVSTSGLLAGGLGNATVNLSGGAINANGGFLAAYAGTATVNVSGSGVLNASGGFVAGSSGTAVVNLSGSGTLNDTGAGAAFSIGDSASGFATMTQGDNSVVSLGSTAQRIGYASIARAGNASYTMNGGSFTAYTFTNVGDLAGSSGTLNVNGGAMTFHGDLFIGKTSATGVGTQTGGLVDQLAGQGNTFLGLTAGATGSYTISGGTFMVGDIRTDAGTGFFNQNGGSVIVGSQAFQNWVRLGVNSSGSMVYTISGASSTLTDYGHMYVGESGTGTFNQINGLVNLPNDHVYIGQNSGAIGAYNLSAGTLFAGDIRDGGDGGAGSGTFTQTGGLVDLRFWLRLGIQASSQGVFTLNGGTINNGTNADGSNNGGMHINVGEAGSGTMNVNGGLMTSTGLFDIGGVDFAGGGSGVVNQTGGVINNSQGEFWVGENGGTGVYNLSNGLLTVGSWLAVGRTAGSSGTVNMTGGTINKIGSGNIIVGSVGGNGTWNMDHGLVTNTTGLILGENTNTGTFFLNGGTVQANGIGSYGTGATGYLYFNGGVLQASASNASFLTTSATNSTVFPYVQAGGAHIDTNGFAIGIGNPIVPDPALIGTDGGLTVTGGGTLTLSGTDTYAGGTRVEGATLIVTNPQGILDGSNLYVGRASSFFAPVVPSPAAAAAVSPVPEPGTWTLMAAILGSVAVYRRMRRK